MSWLSPQQIPQTVCSKEEMGSNICLIKGDALTRLGWNLMNPAHSSVNEIRIRIFAIVKKRRI